MSQTNNAINDAIRERAGVTVIASDMPEGHRASNNFLRQLAGRGGSGSAERAGQPELDAAGEADAAELAEIRRIIASDVPPPVPGIGLGSSGGNPGRPVITPDGQRDAINFEIRLAAGR